MGSTGHYIGSDWSWNGNTREYLDKQINGVYNGISWEVLHSETKGSVYYAAVKRTNLGSGDSYVFAMVQPYKFYGKGWNRELIVKDQDESMGPYACEASAKLLNLLSPTDSEYANRWREDCRKNIEKRKESKAKSEKLEVGDVIVFEAPISFSHYGEYDTFKVVETGRRKRFRAMVNDVPTFMCRLRRDTFKSGTYIIEKGN